MHAVFDIKIHIIHFGWHECVSLKCDGIKYIILFSVKKCCVLNPLPLIYIPFYSVALWLSLRSFYLEISTSWCNDVAVSVFFCILRLLLLLLLVVLLTFHSVMCSTHFCTHFNYIQIYSTNKRKLYISIVLCSGSIILCVNWECLALIMALVFWLCLVQHHIYEFMWNNSRNGSFLIVHEEVICDFVHT